MPTGQSVGCNPSTEDPSSQLTLVCVVLLKTNQHDMVLTLWIKKMVVMYPVTCPRPYRER